MKICSLFKNKNLIWIIKCLGIPVIALYLISMVIMPWIYGDFDWNHTQNVWDRWQTVNSAFIALISSIIALNISAYNSNKQRDRRLTAFKAFLPQALSDLTLYCKKSAIVFIKAYRQSEFLKFDRFKFDESEIPILPESYKEIFVHCIENADAEVGDFLAAILAKLQIHNSRMMELVRAPSDESGVVYISKHSLRDYIYRLGEIQALINQLFPFARSIEPFNPENLIMDDFSNAYLNLDIYPEDIEDLIDFTKRRLQKGEI